jgi:hypothetical protein
MASHMKVTHDRSAPIVEYAGRPENAGKSNRQIAREMGVHESLVRRALAAWQKPEDMPISAVIPMTEYEARACCDRIKYGLDSVRAMVKDLHDRTGWKALGYPSWRACVLAEFDQSQSHLYRQLEAARVEAEVSPNGEIGSIPEAQLRPLAALPEGERKGAWDEAVATAPNGKVTAAHVESVVSGRVSPIGETDPPDIARQRRNGIIPEDAVVEVTEPGPADEDEPSDIQAEQTDEEWLDECPARVRLSESCRRVFDRDALLFRRLTDAREKFHHVATRALSANRKAGPTGTYHSAVSWFLRAKHPRHWLPCKDCEGTGQVPMIGKCPACHGGGYIA